MSEIKKAFIAVIDANTVKDIERHSKVLFDLMDIDKNGFIDKNEYTAMLKAVGCPENQAESASALEIKDMDTDNDGKVSWAEFHRFNIEKFEASN